MYKLKIDLFLRAPIVLEFESEPDRNCIWSQIFRAFKDNRPFSLDPGCGYQGLITINPAYVRAIEEVEE